MIKLLDLLFSTPGSYFAVDVVGIWLVSMDQLRLAVLHVSGEGIVSLVGSGKETDRERHDHCPVLKARQTKCYHR